jgi:hypothetical protein
MILGGFTHDLERIAHKKLLFNRCYLLTLHEVIVTETPGFEGSVVSSN